MILLYKESLVNSLAAMIPQHLGKQITEEKRAAGRPCCCRQRWRPGSPTTRSSVLYSPPTSNGFLARGRELRGLRAASRAHADAVLGVADRGEPARLPGVRPGPAPDDDPRRRSRPSASR